MNEIVTIIIPVYNCREYLEHCVESILCQSYPYIQLILVDDGSTDGSGKICDRYSEQDDRVLVIHQENSGVSAARNRGIDVAVGSYLSFVDGDDAIAETAVETWVRSFEKNVDAVFFGITEVSERNEIIRKLPIEKGDYEKNTLLYGILSDYARYGAGYPTNKIWRISAFGSTENIPRFDTRLYYFEDLEWVVRMIMCISTVRILSDHLYYHTIRSDSVTNRKGAEEHRECGYHQSVWKIIDDLKSENKIRHWFCTKYCPELVNGVLFARKNKYRNLRNMLMEKLVLRKSEILNCESVGNKIKFRCKVILFLHSVHLW